MVCDFEASSEVCSSHSIPVVHTPIFSVSGRNQKLVWKTGGLARCATNIAPTPTNEVKKGGVVFHDPIAQARRAETQRRQAGALRAWKTSKNPVLLDEQFYRREIQPRLKGVALSA